MIVTVPFLGRLHEEPNGLQRLTEHGLRLPLSGAGFNVEWHRADRVGCQLPRAPGSSVIVLSTWVIPIIRWPIFFLNAVFVVSPALILDTLLKPIRRKLPLGYVAVATKPVD